MNNYVRIMRLDHWIKQLFIFPGLVCAIFMVHENFSIGLLLPLIHGFIATCFIASANYVINEWLDAGTDKYHPTKKLRPAVSGNLISRNVYGLWGVLTLMGFILGYMVNGPFFVTLVILWVMGIAYNVKPLRTKDVVFLDVLSESLNNALRFLLGWFIICDNLIPPCSILLGYWFAGAYLMAIKRFAEYRMIDDKAIAGLYRKSFRFYNEPLLLTSACFYAFLSLFLIGVFLVKYRIELLLFIPFLIGLYCGYLYLAYEKDSCVQKPEKLYREKKLLAYCLLLVIWFGILLFCDFSWLSIFTTNKLLTL